jgi:hypothetical protein
MSSICRKLSPSWRWLPVVLSAAMALTSMTLAPAALSAPTAAADHVIISEVQTLDAVAPRAASEFVEIHNPTAAAIDLGLYYLTDGTVTTNNTYYWRIADASPTTATAGGGAFSDFHARFPSGTMLAAGDTIVVSLAGSTKFQTAYGRAPDFELYEDALAPDNVPEMVEAFPGSIAAGFGSGGTNTPALAENGESLVLYRWNGSSELVQDADYIRWGSGTTVCIDKTGIGVGSSLYLADTPVASQVAVSVSALTPPNAYSRLSADEGTEVLASGNGVTGHNETSENLSATWRTAVQAPPAAPASPYAAAPIVTATSRTPATPVIGEAVAVSVTAVSATAVSAVTFHYSVNQGSDNQVAGVLSGANIWTAEFPAQAEGAVVNWWVSLTNAAGGTAIYPSAAPRFTSQWTVIAPPPPTITAFGQSPSVPYADLAATVSVTATSVSALSGAVFHYSVDGGAFAQLTGVAQGGGTYTATVPGQDAGAAVTWYAVVTNSAALSSSSPADAPTSTHGWTVAAAPDPKLLLTEVCTLGAEQEFIEIWNPSSQAVNLSDYYLSDAIYSTANTGYWNMGGGTLNADTVGGGAFTDFTARFPDGFMIAAGDTIVISIPGSTAFTASFGFEPDIELHEDDAFPDAVPDMRSIFPEPNNSIVSSASVPSLTNTGEPVILYKWTEGSPLVTDVDVFVWLAGTTVSYQFSKTGKTVGGATYLPETSVAQQHPFQQQLAFGNSYVRIDATEGAQVTSGSNGVGGRDELSENWTLTWAMQPSDPSRPRIADTGVKGIIELVVPAKTFLPSLGESFPIKFVSRPRSETRVRLYDRDGRLVRTLFDSRFSGSPSTTPGRYTTAQWNGLDETMQSVDGGMYIVHLSVVDKTTGVEETRTAPVVVATRLSK